MSSSTPPKMDPEHPNHGDEYPEPPFYGCEVKCFEVHYNTHPCATCTNLDNCDEVWESTEEGHDPNG